MQSHPSHCYLQQHSHPVKQAHSRNAQAHAPTLPHTGPISHLPLPLQVEPKKMSHFRFHSAHLTYPDAQVYIIPYSPPDEKDNAQQVPIQQADRQRLYSRSAGSFRTHAQTMTVSFVSPLHIVIHR